MRYKIQNTKIATHSTKIIGMSYFSEIFEPGHKRKESFGKELEHLMKKRISQQRN